MRHNSLAVSDYFQRETSILHNLSMLLGSKTQDYISFHGLRSYGRLSNGGPLATSEVYVHNKLMIIDDRAAVIGSSNINDRSLLRSRDSEICVPIEDEEFLESSMNGEPWKAVKFSYSLQCSLWSQHLGRHAGEENISIYQDVLDGNRNELIHSRQSMNQRKEKLK